MIQKLPLFCYGMLFCHLLFISPVTGAENGSFTGEKDPSRQTVDAITVTAQKRQENIQKIPMSISAFSDTQIEDADIGNVRALSLLTPNVHMKSGASTNLLIIRGISNDADFIHSTTGLYVDDICYSMNFMHNPNLFDIERIEVLRGPQGTLYGRNSESGVINIITRQPGDYFTGRVYGEIAAYDPDHGTAMSYITGLSLSGPILEDKLYMGVAGELETSDGFIKNTLTGNEEAGEIDHKNARWTTRWTPSDRLEISTTLDILDVNDGNGNKRYDEGAWKTSPHEIAYSTENNINDQEGDGQNLKIKYTGDNFNLLSITGRRFYENHMLRDSITSPVDDGVNDLTYSSDLISEEIRVTSPGDKRGFEWLGGVYMFREKNETDIDLPALKEIRNTDMETRGYAVFGQGTVTLYEKFRLTAGLRYSYDDMEGEMDYFGPADNYSFEKSFDDHVLLPRFSIAYDLTPRVMAYTTASRGYNAGGYNTAYAVGSENFTYGPEYTWNYEIGLKSSWLKNRLSFNMALFYIEIDDKQVAQLDGVSDVMEVRNAANAHSQGFEMELRARPVQGLDIFAGVGYTDVEFDEWVATEMVKKPGFPTQYVTYDYTGKEFPNAPRYTFNLGAQYRHLSGFYGRADLIMTDDFYSDAKNTQKLDGKTLVNLRTGYEGDHYDVTFWCKNLFNEAYQTIGFARKFDQAVDGEPRMFGVTVSYYF